MLKAATLHLEQKNYGLSRVALEELLQAEPGHAGGSTLLVELEERLKPKVAAASPATLAAGTAELSLLPEADRASPTSAYGVLEREPFQPAPPITTTVSRITARLRRLKSGGPNEESEVKTPPAPEPAPKEAEKVLGPDAALKSAASKLKALAGKKAQETMGEPVEPREPPEASAPSCGEVKSVAAPSAPPDTISSRDSSTVKKMKLDGPASKLAALRKKGAGQPAEEPPPALAAGREEEPSLFQEKEAPAEEPPTTSGDGDGEASPGGAPPTATRKLKLGTAASKLAALKKQKSQSR